MWASSPRGNPESHCLSPKIGVFYSTPRPPPHVFLGESRGRAAEMARLSAPGRYGRTIVLQCQLVTACWGLHTERDTRRRFSHWSLCSHSLSLSLSFSPNYSDIVGTVLGHRHRRGRRTSSSHRRGRALSAPSADGHAHQLLLVLPKIHYLGTVLCCRCRCRCRCVLTHQR